MLTCAAFAILLSGAAWSQSSIKIVVPAPPGGAGDVLARLLTEQVRHTYQRSVVVENRPGAGTIIGTEAAARAAPDGSTLLITGPYLLIAPHLRKLSFDPLSALQPICQLVSSPGVIVVNSASPYQTLADFLNGARVKGRELTFAAVGPGTIHYIGFEMLKRAANVDLTFVPYPGGAPAINALLGRQVTAVLAEYGPVAEHIASGKLRALAATARIDALPQLAVLGETYKGLELDFWWGLFVPVGVANTRIAEFADWYTAALRDPTIRARLTALGFTPAVVCGSDFAAALRLQYERFGHIIGEAHLHPN